MTVSLDNTARIWDAADGHSIAELKGHTDHINTATFSPNSKFIVTASDDKTARIWDASNGKTLLILRGHANPVTTASYSPDGKSILTASGDGIARLFECDACTDVDGLLALANSRVTRDLSCDEQRTFMHKGIDCPGATPTPGK